jgi:hypothetical protein
MNKTVLINKIKLFLGRGLILWFKNILKEWKNFEKVLLFVIPFINIFIFDSAFNFIFVIIVDIIYMYYIQRKS